MNDSTPKIWVRGNKKNPSKVSDFLLSNGGIDANKLFYINSEFIYYIDPNTRAICCEPEKSFYGQLVMKEFEEYVIPEIETWTIELGRTPCSKCPFNQCADHHSEIKNIINCKKYNYSTLKKITV